MEGMANWGAYKVRYTDSFGTNWDHYRSTSNVELIEKKVQQQIEDMCMAGRFSRPFLFDGKIHMVPLRALTVDELAACPVFTDEGTTGRNVVFDKDGDIEKSSLMISRKSDLELRTGSSAPSTMRRTNTRKRRSSLLRTSTSSSGPAASSATVRERSIRKNTHFSA
jgi:hypothetical protein